MCRVFDITILREFCLILWILHEPTAAQIISGPKDRVALSGERVQFECVSKNGNSGMTVNWRFASVGSSDFQIVSLSGMITQSLNSTYKIENTKDSPYSLVIESVNLSYAGTYRCSDDTDKPIDEAQLIVLASDPICGINVSSSVGGILENDSVHMSCRVDYSGNWVPRMEWFHNCGQKTIHHNIEMTNDSSTNVAAVTSSITIQLNSSDNGALFSCTTSVGSLSTRSPNKIDSFNFTYIYYRYTWSHTINVLLSSDSLRTCLQTRWIELIAGGIICVIAILMLGAGIVLTIKADRKAKTFQNEIPRKSAAERRKNEQVQQIGFQSGDEFVVVGEQHSASHTEDAGKSKRSNNDAYASLSQTRFTEQVAPVYDQLHLYADPSVGEEK